MEKIKENITFNESNETKDDLIMEFLICRLCLEKSLQFIEIFAQDVEKQISICAKLTSFLHVEVSCQDVWPKKICISCLQFLEKFSQFYSVVQNNQVILNNKLGHRLKMEGIAKSAIIADLENSNNIVPLPSQEVFCENYNVKTPQWDSYNYINDPLQTASIPNVIESAVPIINQREDIIQPHVKEEFRDKTVNRTRRNQLEVNTSESKAIINSNFKKENIDDNNDEDNKSGLASNCSSENECNEVKLKVANCGSQVNRLTTRKCRRKRKDSMKVEHNDEDEISQAELNSEFSQKDNYRIRLDAPIREHFSLMCKYCKDVKFLTFTTMKKHMEKEHNEQGYVICCNKKLYRREAVIEHISYHLNPKQYDCPLCGQNCKSKITLKIHMKQHIPKEERPFRCDQCEQSFVLSSQLKSHEKSHYTDEQKKFVCDECGKAFAFKFVLDKHKQHMHIREKNFMCEICARSFVDKVNLTAHKRTHDDTLPRLQCPHCDARLKNKVTLKIHLRVHNPTEHPCKLCNKILATKNALMNHIQYVHGEKKHKCTVCEKSFKKALTLREHMSVHTGEVLYSCPYCKKTFNAKANMYSHIKKIHTKEWADAKHQKWLGNKTQS